MKKGTKKPKVCKRGHEYQGAICGTCFATLTIGELLKDAKNRKKTQ